MSTAESVADTLNQWEPADDIDGVRFAVRHVEDDNVGVLITNASPGYVVWAAEGGQRRRIDYADDLTDAKGSLQQHAKKYSNVKAARSFVRETGVGDYGLEGPDAWEDKGGSFPWSIGNRPIRNKLKSYYATGDEIAEASDDELRSFEGLGPATLENLRDEFGGREGDDGPDTRTMPEKLGDMEVEPSGLELDDPATDITGIGSSNTYADDTVRTFWEHGCPFHEVAGQYQADALRDIVGSAFFDVDAPSHLLRVFSGYFGADSFDRDGDQIGNYPEAMFGMFDWSDVAFAWSWGGPGGNVGSEASAGSGIIEEQAAIGAGEDLPYHELDYDPEQDHGLSGLHNVTDVDSHYHDGGDIDVVYTADTSALGDVVNSDVHVPHETVWAYSVLFGIDYSASRVAQNYVKVVVDTTDDLPDRRDNHSNSQWVAVFDHPTAPFYGIAEGEMVIQPWDFDLDASDQFGEWAAEVAARIEERDDAARIPEHVRRGVAPRQQLDEAAGVSALSEGDTHPVDRPEPGADEEFEAAMSGIYDPTQEYESSDDPDPMYAVVSTDGGASEYIRGFGSDEASAHTHADEMGEGYEVQYDDGRSKQHSEGYDGSAEGPNGEWNGIPVSNEVNGWTLYGMSSGGLRYEKNGEQASIDLRPDKTGRDNAGPGPGVYDTDGMIYVVVTPEPGGPGSYKDAEEAHGALVSYLERTDDPTLSNSERIGADDPGEIGRATLAADGNEYDMPVSGNGYVSAKVSDDAEMGIGHGPTVHVRYVEKDGPGLLAVKGRGTNTRLFHWTDVDEGRSTRTTLHGPVSTTEIMRHLEDYIEGERELPTEDSDDGGIYDPTQEFEDDEMEEPGGISGIGEGRRKTLEALEKKGRLDDPQSFGSIEEMKNSVREISLAHRDGRNYISPPQKAIDAIQSTWDALPEEARQPFLNDHRLYVKIRAARNRFNDWMGKKRREQEIPSTMEAGPSNYPSKKANETAQYAREAREELDEAIDKIRAAANGAKQRALKSIGTSVGEQNEKEREEKREERREQFELGDFAFYSTTTYGDALWGVERVNDKSVSLRRPHGSAGMEIPMSDGETYPEYDSARAELDSSRLTGPVPADEVASFDAEDAGVRAPSDFIPERADSVEEVREIVFGEEWLRNHPEAKTDSSGTLLTELDGIGPATFESLESAGIQTVEDAKEAYQNRADSRVWEEAVQSLPSGQGKRSIIEAVGVDPDTTVSEANSQTQNGDKQGDYPGETTIQRLKDMGINHMTAMHLVDDEDTVEDVQNMVESAASNGSITDLPGITKDSEDEVRDAFDMSATSSETDTSSGESQVSSDSSESTTEVVETEQGMGVESRGGPSMRREAVKEAEETEPDEKLSGQALQALKKQWGVYKAGIAEGKEAVEQVQEYQDLRGDAKEAAAIINDIREAHGQEPIDFDGVESIPPVGELAGPITEESSGISLSFNWSADPYDPMEDM